MLNLLKKYWFVVLVIALAYSYIRNNLSYNLIPSLVGRSSNYESADISGLGSMSPAMTKSLSVARYDTSSTIAPSDSQNRLVVQDTSLSLVVNDVSKSIRDVQEIASKMGGFLVNSYLSRPEVGGNGNISIRVPESKRADALDEFKKLSVKVVSESVSGTDVTDQYQDLDSRLEVLYKTKAKFEDILESANNVSELLNVQREIINLQSQIDSLIGQKKYYEQSAKLSKITVYLSTDELALPYTPQNSWRPEVIFKNASRSLLINLRQFGTLLIWIMVYSPIILLGVGMFWFFKRWKKQKLNQ